MKNWRLIEPTSADLFDHLRRIRQIKEEDLSPDYQTHLHDPMLLPDMDKAVELFERAASQNWPIVIFGDYDADGTIATAILSLTLERLGLKHHSILPRRSEGYGLNVEVVRRLPASTKLLITVDNGITAFEAIASANNQGIATIVLDHHLPGEKLPEASALIDPYLPNSRYPFPNLCGAALAYKFVVALANTGNFPLLNEAYLKWLLDLVAIATVADVMPVVGENRALVHFGLLVLRHNRRAGLKALLAEAAIAPSKLSGQNLGFIIGPRFNASGRLGDNRPALELLTTKDPSSIAALAKQIERSNTERLRQLERATEDAEEQIAAQIKASQHLLAAYSPKWPVGLVGLVAGRLANRYSRPVIIGHQAGERITASARSTSHFHLVDNLNQVSQLLLDFGGHRQAAGLLLLEKDWAKVIELLQKSARQQIRPSELADTLLIDSVLSEKQISWSMVQQIEQLVPFGYGNPPPVFLLRGWSVKKMRKIGRQEQHLSFELGRNGRTLKGVAFNCSEELDLAQATLFVGQLEQDEWQGRREVRFKLLDAAGPNKEIESVRFNERQGNIFLQ